MDKIPDVCQCEKKTESTYHEFIAEYEKEHTKAKKAGCEFLDTILAFNLNPLAVPPRNNGFKLINHINY